jgi:hypothetical protein
MIHAYENKQESNGTQLFHTWPLVQTKARHATYTPRTTIDLELCIYKQN